MQQNQAEPNQSSNNQVVDNQSADPNTGSQAQQPSTSYVDSYQPPTTPTTSQTESQTESSPSQPAVPIESPGEIKQPTAAEPVSTQTSTPPARPAQPAAPTAEAEEAEAEKTEDQEEDQSLASQNIFVLLGVTDSSQEEKENFLDELQQVVWEDFLEHDLELLITQEEKAKVDELLASSTDQTMQEELVVYLEKLIPDLEEIIYEKALELKADMVEERIAGMKEYYQGNAQATRQINQAEQLIEQNQWRTAAEVLNAI